LRIFDLANWFHNNDTVNASCSICSDTSIIISRIRLVRKPTFFVNHSSPATIPAAYGRIRTFSNKRRNGH
jgi:hypothetical protein